MRRGSEEGFSLLEVLISMGITLVVMALVFQVARQIQSVYEVQSRNVQRESLVLFALENLMGEISQAGLGLPEGVPSVLPCGSSPASPGSCIRLRSNPEGASAMLGAELGDADTSVPVEGAHRFRRGDLVLLVEGHRRPERAWVTAADATTLALRSADATDRTLAAAYSPARGARILGLREIEFRYQAAPFDGGSLVRTDDLRAPRRLADGVTELGIEYLDERGEPMSPRSVEEGRPVALVRARLRATSTTVSGEVRPSSTTSLATAVEVDQHSARIEFEDATPGWRLVEVMFPIAMPAGIASRPEKEWGVVLASGENPLQEDAYLLTFPLQKQVLGTLVQNAFFLDEVRQPIALAFGPERTRLAGSLFLVAWGLRIGHLARIEPDAFGVVSPESRRSVFEGTAALAMAGGMAFGPDGALYLTGQENGRILRYAFDEKGQPASSPESQGRVPGSPGALALGADGNLYFLVNAGEKGSLWRLPFDDQLAAVTPEEVAALPGRGLSLDLDPLGNSLFALLLDPGGDSIVVEMSTDWVRTPSSPPTEVFRWSRFKEDMAMGRLPPFSALLPSDRTARQLDFLDFDHAGSAYFGAKEFRQVLKFDLVRPDRGDRYAVSLAGVVAAERTAGRRVRIYGRKAGTAATP
jgi:type II secretory pathway pseudopilin PulG